jgi:hypothetical protein
MPMDYLFISIFTGLSALGFTMYRTREGKSIIKSLQFLYRSDRSRKWRNIYQETDYKEIVS